MSPLAPIWLSAIGLKRDSIAITARTSSGSIFTAWADSYAAPTSMLLALPALLISVVGFVESVSVGQTLAARRRQRIEPDRELVALGASNLSAAFSGGFPVTGGFARSVVNFDAGAQTQLAGIVTETAVEPSADLRVIPLEDPTPIRTPGLLWKRGAVKSPAVRHFADIIRAAVGQAT